ncbi:MAG: NADH-quinone oxidoreductase subunit NuoH [candidate division Zixibacteria bacterium]|nr:NADH-quinone oxidoreductase subunit NuoH [candidate division Zixibacteria bacterium]
MDPLVLESLIALAKIGVIVGAVFTIVAYLSFAERRVSAIIQDRYGPNRVGPFGLLQPLADGIKFMWKEEFIPANADRKLFILAPILILVPSLLTFAVIPVGGEITLPAQSILGVQIPAITTSLQLIDLNVGILYILGMTSIAVYGIALGGWSANNKYALLGGIRSSAQMISYELSLGLSIVGVLMLTGSLQMSQIVAGQDDFLSWNIFRQPLGFMLFMVAAFAENNRLPFDLVECEQELVGGYHTEYSSMKFSMFMIAEYANMTAASAMMTTLFFGGWHMPFEDLLTPPLSTLYQVGGFALKTGFFLFFYIWVRWSLPRFRYDQLMGIGWKVLLPLALVNVAVTGVVMLFVK